jgi:hypothetical protein
MTPKSQSIGVKRSVMEVSIAMYWLAKAHFHNNEYAQQWFTSEIHKESQTRTVECRNTRENSHYWRP